MFDDTNKLKFNDCQVVYTDYPENTKLNWNDTKPEYTKEDFNKVSPAEYLAIAKWDYDKIKADINRFIPFIGKKYYYGTISFPGVITEIERAIKRKDDTIDIWGVCQVPNYLYNQMVQLHFDFAKNLKRRPKDYNKKWGPLFGQGAFSLRTEKQYKINPFCLASKVATLLQWYVRSIASNDCDAVLRYGKKLVHCVKYMKRQKDLFEKWLALTEAILAFDFTEVKSKA